MLIMAEELALKVNATEGLRAVLTRKGDTFVPLSSRLKISKHLTLSRTFFAITSGQT